MSVSSDFPKGYRHVTLSSGVRTAARRKPNKTAILCDGKATSYENLVNRINNVANALKRDFNTGVGRHHAILAPNCSEYIEIVCAVSDLGAAVATVNPRLTASEVVKICDNAHAHVLFAHPSCRDLVDLDKFKTVEHVIWLDDRYEEWLRSASSEFTPADIAEWLPFSIPYTSGTTGEPKGVLVSHRSRTLQFYGYAVEYGVYGPDDYFYAIAPLCHGAGFALAMASVFFGGTCEIASNFDPEEVLRTLHEGEVTGIFCVPTHFHKIFDLDSDVLEKYRGHNLRSIMSNAAPLPQVTKQKIVDYFGDGLLHELYGSTEAGIVSNLRPADQLRKQQCVGLPFSGTSIRILDGEGKDVAPNEVGELFSRSPYHFNGYWQNETETEKSYKDEWLSVGDLARFDDEGYLYICGRVKDMVISGGINIYPREIEEVISTHPSVKEIAIVGVPDEEWGERLVAYVVLKSQKKLDVDALTDFCKQKLAGYKIPREFHALEALPVNAVGKILKRELVDNYMSSPS